MQRLARAARSCKETLKVAVLKHLQIRTANEGKNIFTRYGCVTSSPAMPQKGLDNLTVAEVMMTKGEEKTGSWIWCRTTDIVHDAMTNMANNDIGSLVVLKPGDENHIAGIVTERDYLRKVIGQGRSSKHTRVGEIMTEKNRLVTVSSDTNILQAMQLMTANHIRHIPVIDGKIVGMISLADVVRAVVEQQKQELDRLNGFIRGDYY